jgi:Flp pilus assembly protein TadD
MTSVPQAFDIALRHHQSGNLAEAEQLYRQILTVEPRHVNALHLLGLIAHQFGQTDEAIRCISDALRLAPYFPEAHNNLGVALAAEQRFDEAIAEYQKALQLKPEYAEAHNNLGIALAARGRLDEAIARYREAIRLAPQIAEVPNNLGIALAAQGKLEEAVASYEAALRLKPDYAEGHNNLGAALGPLGRLEAAEASYRKALQLKPDYAEAHNNLGVALSAQARLDQAVASYREAIRHKPDYAEAHYHIGMAFLLMGHYERGWPAYEWRVKCKHTALPSLPEPLWDGSPLDGKTILLHTEQGLGDTLQFIRFVPLVKARGGTIVVMCPESLGRLVRTCPGIDRLVTGSELPPFDVHAPLLSLPGILGTTLATLPADVPYLFPDPALVERLRQQLASSAAFKVGIAWQGNPQHPNDRNRSLPLACFEPLSRVEGVQLVSLQKGPGTEQLGAVAGRFPVTDLGSGCDDFMDTAAIVKNLDFVISADTAIAHLAGALAVPVWVAIPFAPDWRWLLHRDDSPWYPTMRLFRQKAWGDWNDVFARITTALKTVRKTADRPGPPTVDITPGELIDRIAQWETGIECRAAALDLDRARAELTALRAAAEQAFELTGHLGELATELKTLHGDRSQAEAGMLDCERTGDFGARFIELARRVCRQNERRVELMRKIDELFEASPT